jgi:uncharacterized protein YnzC (UPF0291/DUF896 family)
MELIMWKSKTLFGEKKTKEERRREEKVEQVAKINFMAAMQYINGLAGYENRSDKILLLDYIIETIKRDLQAEFQSAIIYEYPKVRTIDNPFPYYYQDKQGESKSIFIENELKDVDLSNDCVLALPWDISRVKNAIRNIYYNDFEFMEDNHMANYYEPVGICYVYNGNHSISSGINHKKGRIQASLCDMTPLFYNIRTDGARWYNIHTGEVMGKLFDFRTGLIFEAAQMRHFLEKNERSEATY